MKKTSTFLFCLFTGIIVFIFFAHSLNYPWKFFDEEIIYDEAILPIPQSFSEIFEIISLFGVNNHFEASNPFYSNISNFRGSPFSTIFTLFLFYFFKNSAFNYHLFMLATHTINTCLLFFLINKISLTYYIRVTHKLPPVPAVHERPQQITRILLVSILTLIWSLHPANVESILFATNFGAPVTYFFCLLFILYFVNFYTVEENHDLPLQHSILLFFLYLIPLFLNEYSVTLPIILFWYLFTASLFQNPKITFKEAFLTTTKKLLPFFLGLIVFIIFFILSPIVRTTTNESNFLITIERIFWFSPQVFLHLLKLIFLPINLTIDQTAQVQFSKTLLEPYAIFCSLFMYTLFFLSLISLTFIKKKGWAFFLSLFIPFFLSLLPFLHIISPIYNLASERYLYFPTAILVFGIAHCIFFICSNIPRRDFLWKTSIIVILFFILIILSIRTYIRTLDWKDSITLLSSAVESTSNELFKALREEMKVRALKIFNKNVQYEKYKEHAELANSYVKEALKKFQAHEIKYQNKIPEVIKFYGLDPKTLIVKCGFLLALSEIDLNGDPYKALGIFAPYEKDLKVLDTQILSFYYKILFNTKNIDKAEVLLHKALNQKRITPTVLLALSDLTEYKYNDLKQTEQYLLTSFKFFPYDTTTLFGLRRLYGKRLINNERFAFFSYLFGIRAHSSVSLKEAALVYLALNNKIYARKVLKNLLRNYPIDLEILELKASYEQKFGNL